MATATVASASAVGNLPRHLLEIPSRTMREAYDLIGSYPTSTNGDIFLIRSHIAYWAGLLAEQRAAVRASRGHSYRIDLDGETYIVRICDPYDHRDGVTGFCSEEAQP